MLGNVWEWCTTGMAKSTTPSPRSMIRPGPATGGVRVRRGGAWNSFPLWLRASFRNWNTPQSRCVNLGFRVVRNVE